MSALRPVRDDEVARLWPAVRAARLFGSAEDFAAYRAAGPWRVRISDTGDATVLGEWRHGQDMLWIKGLWATVGRVGALVEDAASVARGQGYRRVLSPLVSEEPFPGYAAAGMEAVESLVAVQSPLLALALHPSSQVSVRLASGRDMAAIADLDRACFEPFWRYGSAELDVVAATERLTVATLGDRIVGYSTIAIHGSAVTLGRIAVGPESRARGVGQALVDEQARHALGRGAHTITLCTQESNEAARAFYRRCGMVELPSRYTLGIRDA